MLFRSESLQRKYPHRKIVFIQEEFIPQIKASKTYLDILIGVFVDNAHKFSGEDQEIDITFNKNQIIIEDFGQGIKEKDREHIFDRFYKGDPSRTKNQLASHGIGLSIAKEIAQQYAIKIEVDSKEAMGTKIILTLDQQASAS